MKNIILLLIALLLFGCNSDFTNQWDSTFPPDKPVTLADSAKCKISTEKTKIAWGDAVMEEKYIVEKQVGTGSWQQVAELAKDSKGYTESGIGYGSAITYRVRSFNSEKDKQYSDYEYFNYYTVSGTISKPDAQPLANTAILGLPYALSTGASGNFCALLPKGWSGSILVAGDYFLDAVVDSLAASTNQNYTTVAALTVSGKIANASSVGIAGVVLNGFPTAVTTDASGNYTATVTYGWSGTVAPVKDGYSFTPASQNYTNVTANQTTNFTGRIEFILVQGGTFNMGDASVSGATPVHSVTLSSFYISKYEVTQQLWLDIMGTKPSYFTGDLNRPVETVSWYDIMVYCNKRSIAEGKTPCYSISGSTEPAAWGTVPTNSKNATWDAAICNWSAKGYRLPTEAEWEFAARGGNSSQGYTYSGSNTIDNVAWYSTNSDNTTHSVGTKAPNELGIYDMSGNVWEWNWDWYAYYTATAQINPTGAATGTSRLLRGGAYGNVGNYCRVASRNNSYPYDRGSSYGFRLARTY